MKLEDIRRDVISGYVVPPTYYQKIIIIPPTKKEIIMAKIARFIEFTTDFVIHILGMVGYILLFIGISGMLFKLFGST